MKVGSISPVNFGIYKGTKITRYGKRVYGEYKDYKIDIYIAEKEKQKLYYVTDKLGNWVKSKLAYWEDTKKKIARCEADVKKNQRYTTE